MFRKLRNAATHLERLNLPKAKKYDWRSVFVQLKENPRLLNAQPSGRYSALHQASEASQESMQTSI